MENIRKLSSILVFTLISILLGCQSTQVKSKSPDMPSNAYLDGGESKVGVILCHGRGKYPTWRVVNPLHKGIHQQLGYHTLSIQMPTGEVGWREYVKFFPNAYKRIEGAINVLRNEKGVETIYLMGHSMGTRMASGYLANFPGSKVAGFIGVGARNYGEGDLDTTTNLSIAMQKLPNLQIVDIYGDGGDGIDASHALQRAQLVSDRYKQILIPGADHQFFSGEKQMVNAVVNWLKEQK